MEKVTTHVGLDVHMERIVVASLEGQAREPTILDIPNDPKVIRRTFKRLASEACELRCCYEAGPCGYRSTGSSRRWASPARSSRLRSSRSGPASASRPTAGMRASSRDSTARASSPPSRAQRGPGGGARPGAGPRRRAQGPRRGTPPARQVPAAARPHLPSRQELDAEVLDLGRWPEVRADVRAAHLRALRHRGEARAHHRLHRRYARLIGKGKKPQLAVTAVARELCGFLWGVMTMAA